MSKQIAIIGGGNLGSAIAEGLLKSKFARASQITVTKRNTATLEALKEKGIIITNDNNKAVDESDVVILAVKPFQVADVLSGIKTQLTKNKVLISVVTGVLISEMENIIQPGIPLFRAMPNTAISYSKV